MPSMDFDKALADAWKGIVTATPNGIMLIDHGLVVNLRNVDDPTSPQPLDTMISLATAWTALTRTKQRPLARVVDDVGYKIFGAMPWVEFSGKTYMDSISETRVPLDDAVYTDAEGAVERAKVAIAEAQQILKGLGEKEAATVLEELLDSEAWPR